MKWAWRLINRKRISWYKREHLQLSPEGQRICESLQRDGIAVSSLEALFPKQALLSQLLEQTEALRPQARLREKKPYLVELWEPVPTLDLNDSFAQLALSTTVLDPINSYLGLWGKFYYHMLAITEPRGVGAVARESQRWHRDPEDIRMCKFFVYLSDVDQSAGPFSYIRGSHLGGAYRLLFPQQRPWGSYPPDGAIEAAVPKENFAVCTGKAGTVIFADTSGLHRGGYATHTERIMYTAGYMTNASSSPVRYQLPKNRESLSKLPQRVRSALSLP